MSNSTTPSPDRTGTALASRSAGRWESQRSFDELGRPLRDITFCVVDLETTGGSAAGGSMITEVGAVKVRGGEVLGEFQTLVNPGRAIPPEITVLTGITQAMVVPAPRIEDVLGSLLDLGLDAGLLLGVEQVPGDRHQDQEEQDQKEEDGESEQEESGEGDEGEKKDGDEKGDEKSKKKDSD